MDDTVWSQIVVLFDGFLHHSVLFLVFLFSYFLVFFNKFQPLILENQRLLHHIKSPQILLVNKKAMDWHGQDGIGIKRMQKMRMKL